MDDQLLIFGCTFASVALFGYALTRMFIDRDGDKLRDRLTRPANGPSESLISSSGGPAGGSSGGSSATFGGGFGGGNAAGGYGDGMEMTSVDAATQRTRSAGRSKLMKLFQRAGQAAAQPFMPKSREKQSGLRQTLG